MPFRHRGDTILNPSIYHVQPHVVLYSRFLCPDHAFHFSCAGLLILHLSASASPVQGSPPWLGQALHCNLSRPVYLSFVAFVSVVVLHLLVYLQTAGFPGGSVVKNPPDDAGDLDSTPGLGRSPGEGNATHSSILAWEIPWTEEPGGLQPMGSQNTQFSDWVRTTLTAVLLFRLRSAL